MSKLRTKRMVDRLMEAYVRWREACLQVNEAYACWTSERGIRATVAFGSYMAALDREGDAADAYAALVLQTREVVSGGHDPSVASGGPTWRPGRR